MQVPLKQMNRSSKFSRKLCLSNFSNLLNNCMQVKKNVMAFRKLGLKKKAKN